MEKELFFKIRLFATFKKNSESSESVGWKKMPQPAGPQAQPLPMPMSHSPCSPLHHAQPCWLPCWPQTHHLVPTNSVFPGSAQGCLHLTM